MWKRKKFSYVSAEEAQQIMVKTVNVEARRDILPLKEAYNRVLADDVISDADIPPFSVSHFDGYAVIAKDTLQASVDNPTLLRVVSPVEGHEHKISAGETAYVLTGTRLVKGADAVVPVEMVKLNGDLVEVRHVIQQQEHVIPAGADIKSGETVLRAGWVLRAQDVKLLMDIKKWEVKVFRKPTVAMISVGSELTDLIEETNVKKYNSQALMISTMLSEAGGVPLDLGIAPDDSNLIRLMIEKGLKKADIVTTIGGCSVGEKDYVWEVIKSLQPSALIRGVKVHPGRVASLGVVNRKAIVMLPGHIQSTLVGFYVLLLPLIRLMNGLPTTPPYPTLRAIMSRKLAAKKFSPFERIRFVKVAKEAGGYVAEPVLGDSSLTSVVVKANGFVIMSMGRTVIEEGEEVIVYLLPGLFPLNQEIERIEKKEHRRELVKRT